MEKESARTLAAAVAATGATSVGWALASGVDPGPLLPVVALYGGFLLVLAGGSVWVWDYRDQLRRKSVPRPRVGRGLRCLSYAVRFRPDISESSLPYSQRLELRVDRDIGPRFEVKSYGLLDQMFVRIAPDHSLPAFERQTPYSARVVLVNRAKVAAGSRIYIDVNSREFVYVKRVTSSRPSDSPLLALGRGATDDPEQPDD